MTTADQNPVIEINHLKRSFGNVHAVRDISFNIYPGQVVGFIGANGAGKTTTMRMMATLERPDSGEIYICGLDAIDDPNAVRSKIGWVPDDFGRYPYLTIEEYLDFFSRAFDYKGQERRNRIAEVMEFTGLTPLKERYIDKLSKGQGQRLCLGRALLHDPEILLMDEPAAGLDPKARVELKNLILILAEEGKTIFISSHILSELQEMCNTMLFIDSGKVLHHGSAEELKRGAHEQLGVYIELASGFEKLEHFVDLNPGIQMKEITTRGGHILFDNTEDEFIAETLKRMIAEGLPVIEFRREEKRLEDAFVDLLDKVDDHSAGGLS